MSDNSVNPNELQAIADRSRIRAYSALIGPAVTLVAMIAFVIVAILFLGSSNKNNAISESTNCARSYSSILGKPVTLRDNLTSEIASLVGEGQGIFGTALLNLENGIQPSPAVISAFEANGAKLQATTMKLDKAIAVVKAEPTNAHATIHGFTLDGHHYPACPQG